jgi:hypothetical protein
MANNTFYKYDKISGWQRSYAVAINNPYNEIPNITFSEEVVILNDGQIIKLPSSQPALSADLADPNTEIVLLNPLDDTILGTGTYGQIQVLLYSLYKKLAQERDNVN